MRIRLIVWIGCILAVLSTQAQAKALYRHIPPAETTPRKPLTLTVSIEQEWEAALEIHFRTQGTSSWQLAKLGRTKQKTYETTIPANYLQPPGLEYFIVVTKEGNPDSHVFASITYPHRVKINEDPKVNLQTRLLEQNHRRRAGVRIAGEWVDYGRDAQSNPASYYRMEAAVSYLLLALPIKTLRLGYVEQRGETRMRPLSCKEELTSETAFRGSWFALGLIPKDGIELDLGGIALLNTCDFSAGGQGELRVGVERGTHIAVGGELIPGIGFAGHFRLAWSTVPDFFMAASVALSNHPGDEERFGVRLIYDLARQLAYGFSGGLRFSYQARDRKFGRLTGGLSLTYEF